MATMFRKLPPLKPNSVRFYLCRHGETIANSKRLIQGAGINSPLTDVGRTQSINLASAFSKVQFNISRVISSTLTRAQQTAEPLAIHGNTVEIFPQLREMEYGDLEGMSIAKIETMKKIRALWEEWKLDINIPCPGEHGESMASLMHRAENILWSIAQDSHLLASPHVVVVSHSMFLRAAIARFLLSKQQDSNSASESQVIKKVLNKVDSEKRASSLQMMSAMDNVQLANTSITVVDFDMSLSETSVLVIGSTDHVYEEIDQHTIVMSKNDTSAMHTYSTNSGGGKVQRRIGTLQRHFSTSTAANRTTNRTASRTVIIGSDHGGFDLKMQMIEHLELQGYQVQDVGCHSATRCDYPDIAALAGKATLDESNTTQRGIVVCGSGIGISIAANKVPGVRCALLHDHYGAVMCRKHNNANMIALGGRTTGVEVAKEIVDAFLNTEFEGGRHSERVAKIEL